MTCIHKRDPGPCLDCQIWREKFEREVEENRWRGWAREWVTAWGNIGTAAAVRLMCEPRTITVYV